MKRTKKRRLNTRDAARLRNATVRKRRRKRKYMLYYILIFIIFVTTAVSLSLTVFFNIDEIVVLNSGAHTTDEIISIGNVKIGDNLVRTSLKKIEDNVLDECLDIDKVSVKRSFPNKLIIDCLPCDVKFCYQKNDGMYVYVSSCGRVTETEQSAPPDNTLILKINTDFFEDCHKGQYIELPQEDKTKINKLINKLDSVGCKDINRIVFEESKIYVTYQNRIVIEIPDISKTNYMIDMSMNIINDYIGLNERGKIFLDNFGQSVHFLPEGT